MSIVVQSTSNRGAIAESFDRVAATLLVRSAQSCYALHALATTNALPWRLCYLSIADLGASGMLLLRSCRSGQLHVWFKSQILGVRFYSILFCCFLYRSKKKLNSRFFFDFFLFIYLFLFFFFFGGGHRSRYINSIQYQVKSRK